MSPKSKILRVLSFAEVAEICNNENICLNLNVQIKERMVKPTESKSKVKLNNTKKYRHIEKIQMPSRNSSLDIIIQWTINN